MDTSKSVGLTSNCALNLTGLLARSSQYNVGEYGPRQARPAGWRGRYMDGQNGEKMGVVE